jgi:hypothetical protein
MYQVLLKLNDGRVSYLEHRNRREWTLRTARKHIKDVMLKRAYDSSYPVKYATLVKA